MTATPLTPLYCLAATVAVQTFPTTALDVAEVARTWPSAQAMRFLKALPVPTAIASYEVLASFDDATCVAQVLRQGALNEACGDYVFRQLYVLHQRNPARACSLRRAMEWELHDTAFWPHRKDWPSDTMACIAQIAAQAEADWDSLPLPCIYRLPAPDVYPDHWGATQHRRAVSDLPDVMATLEADPFRAGLEWMHWVWLDPTNAFAVKDSVSASVFASWLRALDTATDPFSEQPVPYDLVLLDHLSDERDYFLSQIEVDSLLSGVTKRDGDDERFHSMQDYPHPAACRNAYRKAVLRKLIKMGIEFDWVMTEIPDEED